MISAFQKISGAISSFIPSKEPKTLKRPSHHSSSQPNEPSRSPPAAHMPKSRSSTSSSRNTKRQKGAKATEFLLNNLDLEEEGDDPIEVCFLNLHEIDLAEMGQRR
jgi:hypothetical protein